MPERTQYRSLLPIDVGFDLRDTGHSIRVYEGFGYWYLDRANKKTFAGSMAGLMVMAEVLALAGYCVVPLTTPDGKDVVVVPDLTSPGNIVWNFATGSERGPRWYQGKTVQEALEKSEWKLDDLQPLSSDEYV